MELVETLGNEAPPGLKAAGIVTRDGTRLRLARTGRAGSTRGTVCIFPGRGEFIEKYFETIAELQSRGFAVAILEWRGQGRSDRPFRNRYRGHVKSFADYDNDMNAFMTGTVLPDCPPPYFALGHSTGGHMVLRTIRQHTWFNRAVVTAPLVALAPRALPWPLLRRVVQFVNSLGLSALFAPGQNKKPPEAEDFPGNPLTSDIGRFTRDCRTLEVAPDLGLGGATIGWLNAALDAMRELQRMTKSGRPRSPALIIAAGADRITSPEAARELARKTAGLSAVTIEGARHEILQEANAMREQFWAAFDSFIE